MSCQWQCIPRGSYLIFPYKSNRTPLRLHKSSNTASHNFFFPKYIYSLPSLKKKNHPHLNGSPPRCIQHISRKKSNRLSNIRWKEFLYLALNNISMLQTPHRYGNINFHHQCTKCRLIFSLNLRYIYSFPIFFCRAI